jgi:hypothetical protein
MVRLELEPAYTLMSIELELKATRPGAELEKRMDSLRSVLGGLGMGAAIAT